MCYAGGPYCPKVATEKLSVAKKERNDYLGSNNDVIKALDDGIKNATIGYMTTTKGIKELKEKALSSGNPNDQENAEFFAKRRKELIAQNKQSSAHTTVKKKTPTVVASQQKTFPVYNATFEEPQNCGTKLWSVEHDSDGRYCQGDIGDDESDGYCRDAAYENLHVSSIRSVRAVLGELFRTNESNIPPELEKIGINELHLDNLDSYEAVAEYGYYGEEAEVLLADPQGVNNRLRAYYFSRDDAVDKNKVLPYLRGKGLDTTGLQPLEAVKKHLREENGGKHVGYVEKTTNITTENIPVKDIFIPQKKHYSNVEAAPSKAPKGAPVTHGIVVKKDGVYHLVDGYHRVKGLNEAEKKAGVFIVLS